MVLFLMRSGLTKRNNSSWRFYDLWFEYKWKSVHWGNRNTISLGDRKRISWLVMQGQWSQRW